MLIIMIPIAYVKKTYEMNLEKYSGGLRHGNNKEIQIK